MDNKKIEGLLDITYGILLGQNKNIQRYEKELKELEETLSESDEDFFILGCLCETMISSLQEAKKKYFFEHIKDFIEVHNLSKEMKEYALKKLEENCNDETESIGDNSAYKECSADSRKLEKEMRENFSDEEKPIFEIYLNVLVEIESEESHLFYEAMLQTGAYLNKIKEITGV